MKLQDILAHKGTAVHTIGPQASLADVVDKLVQNNCGSLIVTDGDQTVGIITERDILRATASNGGTLGNKRVADHMSSKLITGTPADTVEQTMGQMTDNRIRHLPIMEANRLVGIISIGDVVKAQHDNLTVENHLLKSYIHGDPTAVPT